MNYIRSAFSTASQYYTSLPSINPSTLTGAIDVIVIQRESEECPGETELACSPFHVRFGKWQAFRPSDKKVNVLVNGEPIPFNMKVGEAGEAFFVLETDDDVPAELLTSPLLEATKPEEPQTGRFGANNVHDQRRRQTSPITHTTDAAKAAINADPSFLDLESGERPTSRAQSSISSRSASPTPPSRRHTHDHDTASQETTDEEGEDHSTPPTSTPTSRKSSNTAYEQPQRSMTASPSSFLASLVLPSRPAAKADSDARQEDDRSIDTYEGEQQKGAAANLQSSAQSVGAALSHGSSAVAANITKAKNAMKKNVTAAYPTETLNMLRRRGTATTSIATGTAAGYLESRLGGESGGDGGEIGIEPTYGHDAVVDMAGYHYNKVPGGHAHAEGIAQSDEEVDFPPNRIPSDVDESPARIREDLVTTITPPLGDSGRSNTLPQQDSGSSTPSWNIPSPSKHHHNFDTMPLSRRRQFMASSSPLNDFPSRPHSTTSMLSSATKVYPFHSISDSDANKNRNGSQSQPQPPPPFRAESEPPELQLPSPDASVSSSPPDPPGTVGLGISASASLGRAVGAAAAAESEYMWEWGAFPQRSPSIDKFVGGTGPLGIAGSKAKSKSSPLSPPDTASAGTALGAKEGAMDRVGGTSPTLEPSRMASTGFLGVPSSPPQPDHSKPSASSSLSAEDSAMFGFGGRLFPSAEDDRDFWVDIEGKHFTFQLSLCGPLVNSAVAEDQATGEPRGEARVLDEVDKASRFEDAKVNLTRFITDTSLLDREDLVIKWGTAYVSKRDSSPLFSALGHWRGSVDMPAAKLSQPPSTHSRGSSWTRWWSRRDSSSSRAAVVAGDAKRGDTSTSKAASSSQLLTSTLRSSRSTIPISQTVPAETPTLDAKPIPSAPTSPELSSRGPSPPLSPQRHYVKTLRLASDQLKQLNLKKGSNTITFSLSASGAVACTARIFLWESSDLIVVSDIDGTITKSDALGHVFTMIGRDWTHVGVAKLYTDISKNGYNIMYLTSRAIGQADSTRVYLKGIKQNNHQLPEGPVIMSPDRLMASLHREVIMRKPEVFKMACLRDIQRLFGPQATGHFYAGFGNRITDALSYRSVNIPSSRIFTIDSTGEVKMELLELAGYKSSYIHMTDLVDQMFPPVHRNVAGEFTDFNFWRPPMQEFELPDLVPEPASPALSARSDTSRLSRLRSFRLVSRSSTSLSETNKASGAASFNGDTSQRQKERQSSPLASPVLGPEDAVDDDDDYDSEPHGHKRDRRLSMPGSINGKMLDDEGFGEHDGELPNDDAEEGSDDEVDDEDPEAAFDDDLLATGEMDDIPLP